MLLLKLIQKKLRTEDTYTVPTLNGIYTFSVVVEYSHINNLQNLNWICTITEEYYISNSSSRLWGNYTIIDYKEYSKADVTMKLITPQ